MVFRRGSRSAFYVWLPTRTGREQRSTGTSDRATGRAIARMLDDLGPRGKRAWDLLDAVRDGALSLAELYDSWQLDDLEDLRARRADVDLAEHVASWQAWLQDRTKPDTAQHYLAHLSTLIADGKVFRRSQLTAPVVAQWLATRTALTAKRRRAATGSRRQPDPSRRPAGASTKRKYLAAVQSFPRYVVELGILSANPLRDVSPPPAAHPRCTFLSSPTCGVWSRGPPHHSRRSLRSPTVRDSRFRPYWPSWTPM